MGVGSSAELKNALAAFSGQTSSHQKPKTVWLVRHTRSEQNSGERLFEEGECWKGLTKMLCGFDAPPSQRGYDILKTRRGLGDKLKPRLEVIFYSPLKRAKETKDALFGLKGENQFQMDFIKEKTRREHCSCWRLDKRVRRFELEFLRAVPLNEFALVGHSIFFRQLVFGTRHTGDAGFLMGNVDIWRVEVPEGSAPIRLLATYTTCGTLTPNKEKAKELIDLVHLGRMVVSQGVEVHCDYFVPSNVNQATQGADVDAWRGLVADGLEGLSSTVHAEMETSLEAEGVTWKEAVEAFAALSRSSVSPTEGLFEIPPPAA